MAALPTGTEGTASATVEAALIAAGVTLAGMAVQQMFGWINKRSDRKREDRLKAEEKRREGAKLASESQVELDKLNAEGLKFIISTIQQDNERLRQVIATLEDQLADSRTINNMVKAQLGRAERELEILRYRLGAIQGSVAEADRSASTIEDRVGEAKGKVERSVHDESDAIEDEA